MLTPATCCCVKRITLVARITSPLLLSLAAAGGRYYGFELQNLLRHFLCSSLLLLLLLRNALRIVFLLLRSCLRLLLCNLLRFLRRIAKKMLKKSMRVEHDDDARA